LHLVASYVEPFEFLYNIEECDKMDDKQLKEKCRSLKKALSDEETKDIEAEEVEMELKYCCLKKLKRVVHQSWL
jgi:hypothetical protein